MLSSLINTWLQCFPEQWLQLYIRMILLIHSCLTIDPWTPSAFCFLCHRACTTACKLAPMPLCTLLQLTQKAKPCQVCNAQRFDKLQLDNCWSGTGLALTLLAHASPNLNATTSGLLWVTGSQYVLVRSCTETPCAHAMKVVFNILPVSAGIFS